MKHVIVIGAGFAGLSAACHLTRHGARVTLLERHDQPGGRARSWSEDGFKFDMGPSWYWMPDIFERFFRTFGREIEDVYDLRRLDPSYRIVWSTQPGLEPTPPPQVAPAWDLPAGVPALRTLFESVEPGAGRELDRFLTETGHIYERATSDFLLRPSLSIREYMDPALVGEVLRMRMLRSMASYARDFVSDPRLARLLEWPVLFLGASARRTPAMYALMSYADMALGTWYPMGGMHRIIEGMVAVGRDLGVDFRFGHDVKHIRAERGRASGVQVVSAGGRPVELEADAVLASADYHQVEQSLLAPEHRQYSKAYWSRRTMSPSSLVYYLGVTGRVEGLPHHTLFFDQDLDAHMEAVYSRPEWPEDPLFYVSHASATDDSVAPPGDSALFLLVPLAPGLTDSDAQRERTYQNVMSRLEAHLGEPLRHRVRVKRDYAMRDFEADYGAFRGNAYGLANTLGQTGPLKPGLRSKKLRGLYFAGQLTVPGPGMPPSLISGELSASVLADDLQVRS